MAFHSLFVGFLLGSLLSPRFTVNAACPLGFSLSGSWCYRYIAMEASWLDAKAYCEAMNSNLTSMPAADDQDYVISYINNELGLDDVSFTPSEYQGATPRPLQNPDGTYSTAYLWTAGSNLFGRDVWTWMTSPRPSNVTFSKWASQQPWVRPDSAVHCVAMDMSQGGRWLMYPCGSRLDFVCARRELSMDEPLVG